MGGKDFIFEEEKTSADMIDFAHGLFMEHGLYICAALGVFVFAVMAYVFTINDTIGQTPEVQWHLKELKKEQEDFEKSMK